MKAVPRERPGEPVGSGKRMVVGRRLAVESQFACWTKRRIRRHALVCRNQVIGANPIGGIEPWYVDDILPSGVGRNKWSAVPAMERRRIDDRRRRCRNCPAVVPAYRSLIEFDDAPEIAERRPGSIIREHGNHAAGLQHMHRWIEFRRAGHLGSSIGKRTVVKKPVRKRFGDEFVELRVHGAMAAKVHGARSVGSTPLAAAVSFYRRRRNWWSP